MAQGNVVARMLGAARLNVLTFEEVEADETATGQAAAVVAMVAVASAIGSADSGVLAAAFAPVAQIIGWLIWAGVTYIIGDKIFGGQPPGGSFSGPWGSPKLRGFCSFSRSSLLSVRWSRSWLGSGCWWRASSRSARPWTSAPGRPSSLPSWAA